MRKKIKTKLLAPKKERVATYLDIEMWQQIKEEAQKAMTSESHIMRVLLSEALQARCK